MHSIQNVSFSLVKVTSCAPLLTGKSISLNEHTDLNSGVVVVRPIETSFPPSLSTQDGLYTTIIRGLNEKGEAVSDARLIRSVNREISVYSEYDEFLKLAHNPEMRFVFSNTTEAGISYHAGDKFDDAPA